jgi:hypothetical protein
MENSPPRRQPVPEYVQHVMARIAVVYDHRQFKLCRHVQLGYEKFNLGLFIPEFPVIVQAYFAYGYHTGKLYVSLYNFLPVPAGILDFRGTYPNGMVHIGGRFEILIDPAKIMKTVTDRDYTVNGSLAGLLNNNELLNRVITNEPYVGVSIKILHGFIQRNGISSFPNWTH